LIHEYCPVSKVPEEMNRLITLYHTFKSQNVSPIVLAAWLHLSFIQIHPFQDGNGRVARSLSSIVLIENGLFPLIVSLKEKSKYIRALDLANTKNDYSQLIQFIVEKQLFMTNELKTIIVELILIFYCAQS
jgi:Fic family protein